MNFFKIAPQGTSDRHISDVRGCLLGISNRTYRVDLKHSCVVGTLADRMGLEALRVVGDSFDDVAVKVADYVVRQVTQHFGSFQPDKMQEARVKSWKR